MTGEHATGVIREGADDEDAQAASRSIGGLSAGDGFDLGGYGLWASFGRSDFESEVTVARYDANQNSFLAGIDTLFLDQFVIGLALGYENTSADTAFNGGDLDVDGFTVAPYVAYFFNDIFSADASVGYSHLQHDQSRIDPANAATLTGEFASNRAFVTGNLNALYFVDNWVLGGRVGFLHSGEIQEPYVEQGGPSIRSVRAKHLDLTQGYVGADVAYSFGVWEPYVVGMYRNDFGRDDGSGAGGLPSAVGSTQPDDDDEFQLGLGVRYFGDNGITGNLEWLTTQGRSQFDEQSFNATIRIDL